MATQSRLRSPDLSGWPSRHFSYRAGEVQVRSTKSSSTKPGGLPTVGRRCYNRREAVGSAPSTRLLTAGSIRCTQAIPGCSRRSCWERRPSRVCGPRRHGRKPSLSRRPTRPLPPKKSLRPPRPRPAKGKIDEALGIIKEKGGQASRMAATAVDPGAIAIQRQSGRSWPAMRSSRPQSKRPMIPRCI